MIHSRQFPFRFLNAHDSINDLEARLKSKGITYLPNPVCPLSLRVDELGALVCFSLLSSGLRVWGGQRSDIGRPKGQGLGQVLVGGQKEETEAD